MLVATVPIPCEPGTIVWHGKHGKNVLIDPDDWERLKGYKWFVKQSGSVWYCCRKVTSKNSVFFVRMHRQIMHTKPGHVPHHLNGNGLDNRKVNLINVTKQNHNFFH